MPLDALTTSVITLKKANRISFASGINSDLKRMIASMEDKNYMLGNVIPIFVSCIDDTGFADIKTSAAGGGASLIDMKSKLKACGEFIERHCGLFDKNSHISKIVFDSYDGLKTKGESCLCLSGLIPYEDSLYGDSSFPYKRYNPGFSTTWIKGIELTNNKDTWLPAQKVFYRYPHTEEDPSYIGGLSTGLACGSSYSHAALGAIYEVIERDSFMLTWLLQIPGKAIKMDAFSNTDLQALYNHICKYLIGEDKLFIYDISKTKGVYTVLTYIRNDLPNAYGLIVSAASHLNPEIALLKSLEELCQSQMFAYQYLSKDTTRECQNMKKEDIDTLHKNFFYYCTGRHSKNIDFISATGKHIPLSEMPNYAKPSNEDDLEHLIQLFRSEAQPVYIADATKAELSKSSLYVLKAIIPGYVDLNTSYKYRNQKCSRLQKYQEELGVEINNEPHPFP